MMKTNFKFLLFLPSSCFLASTLNSKSVYLFSLQTSQFTSQILGKHCRENVPHFLLLVEREENYERKNNKKLFQNWKVSCCEGEKVVSQHQLFLSLVTIGVVCWWKVEMLKSFNKNFRLFYFCFFELCVMLLRSLGRITLYTISTRAGNFSNLIMNQNRELLYRRFPQLQAVSSVSTRWDNQASRIKIKIQWKIFPFLHSDGFCLLDYGISISHFFRVEI